MEVRATHAAADDFDIDVFLFPFLGLKLAPLHLSLDRVWTQAHPTFKLQRVVHCSVVSVLAGLESWVGSWMIAVRTNHDRAIVTYYISR